MINMHSCDCYREKSVNERITNLISTYLKRGYDLFILINVKKIKQ